ncbi:hypothetical protein AA313_de0202557 [Arthrobotrys entomopaga]|nr:hypothetical protein AA313_de0202557 [Arthrobotrys entomopaga]
MAARVLDSHPLPASVNVYEMSKLLGEFFVSQLPRYSLMRISSAYGPAYTRGFVSRAIYPNKTGAGNVQTAEKRDFIYADDLNELLWKAAAHASQDDGTNTIFDAASGESIDLREVWAMVRAMTGDHAIMNFRDSTSVAGQVMVELKPDPTFARRLLGKTLTPFHVGLRKTIDHRELVEVAREKVGAVQDKDEDSNVNEDIRSGRWTTRPHVIVVDVGGTYLRIGIMGPGGILPQETRKYLSPSKQKYPRDSLSVLQGRLLEMLAREIGSFTARRTDLLLKEVGIAFGAVVTNEGIVQDASILWGDSARGYNLAKVLLERLPGMRLKILNDVSAAAWRYKDEGRFCLITVSSGLSNKVYNANLNTLERLDLDTAGVGGEMGHVVVEPRAVDKLVEQAKSHATGRPDEFKASKLYGHVNGDIKEINARNLGMAAQEEDNFALGLLEEAEMPYCPCGNIADLCSYSSGRGVLRRAKSLAARQKHHGIAPDNITDSWLQHAISVDHPIALKVLDDSTYYLALRILQLAADLGLDKFIIVGGFPNRTAGNGIYLKMLQQHLAHLCHGSAFFRGWSKDRVCNLVKLGVDDDNDGLIGMGYFVKHLCSHYYALEKSVGEQTLTLKTRRIPKCGAREFLAKVVYAGICTTDLQLLRNERGLEPVVLGHEGVCRVLKVGKDVKGVEVGEVVVLNPNNPLDDYDKLGHTREGLFQEYIKVGQEFLDRSQVLCLGRSEPRATDTLIEPLSCVVAAQNRIKDRIPGRNVLVVGAGFMSLLFIMMNVKMDARNVFLMNRSRERLDYAVSRGFVEEKKAFVADGSSSSPLSLVNKVTAGEGVDIVIICVSLGQGVQAAQQAIAYVNPGGCVYLFAGFRPGDMLAPDGEEGGVKLDAWSIRSNWKTERIHTAISGKAVDISGHRGSRQEDLATAADLVRRDSLLFDRVVSHFISLSALPESMLTLAQDGKIQGVPAKRVIVDMGVRGKMVEQAEEIPLRLLREAAGRSKDAIDLENPFRLIGFDGATSHLGWVHPQKWPEIQVSLEGALGTCGLSSKRHVIWVGTGPWAFLVDALGDLIPVSGGSSAICIFHTCYSLDPQALEDLFLSIDDLSMTICIGISQSGKTLETVALMNTLREHFDNTGLDYRQHFIWLTDRSGDSVVRSIGSCDWQHVSVLPLTTSHYSNINALFCAPHSMVMFLPLILLLRQDWKAMRSLYYQYLAFLDEVIQCGVLSDARFVALNSLQNIRLDLDESIAQVVPKLAIQLIEQALGSKQVAFNPRIRIAAISKTAVKSDFETAVVTLQMPAEASVVVKVMLTMYALSVFVSSVAYHRRIEFVTHPKVDLYKRRAAGLMAGDHEEVEHKLVDPESVMLDEVATYLKGNPQTRFVEILYYGRSYREKVGAKMMEFLFQVTQGLPIEVFQGEEWNHSRYQAAVQREDTVYVVLVLHDYLRKVKGVSDETIYYNVRLLRAIARGTFSTLRPRAFYLQITERFLEHEFVQNPE